MSNLHNYDQDPLFGQQELDLLQTPDGSVNVSCAREVSESEQEKLWSMIAIGFAALDSRSFERQSMTLEEFEGNMASADVLKYVGRDKLAEPIGMMIVHHGIETVPWIEQDRFIDEQDKLDPGVISNYVGSLVVTADKRGGITTPSLVRGALRHQRDYDQRTGREHLVFFDCAHANFPWLATIIENYAKPSPSDGFEGVPTEVREIGQDYWTTDLDADELSDLPHVAKKVRVVDTATQKILDTQHFYSQRVIKPAQ